MAKDPPPRGERFPMLVSYAFVRHLDARALRIVLDSPWFDLMLDSGAFSAANSGETIPLDEYCAFLARWKDKFWQYVMLDVIGDPAGTRRNLDAMLARGLDPMPVHVLGDGRERMDELFSRSSRVCLGGLLRPGRGHADEGYVAAKMAWAGGRPVHWLGYVRAEAVQKHRPYSCDSSSWSSGERYGQVRVYAGGGKMLQYSYAQLRQGGIPLALSASASRIGFSPMDLLNRSAWSNRKCDWMEGPRSVVTNVNADAFVRYSMDLRARFGTRMFLVCAFVNVQWPALVQAAALAMGCAPTRDEMAEAARVRR